MTVQAASDEVPLVLVVEDEALLLLDAIDIVEHAGFRAIGAYNADEALRLMVERPDISAVFTDIAMPGSMDGLKLAFVIRERWPPVALIVASGHVRIDKVELPAGCVFLSKPYAPVEVGEALRELLSSA